MSKQQNFSTGRIGEEMAVEYLKKKGYRIVARNWRSKFGEIDIIAELIQKPHLPFHGSSPWQGRTERIRVFIEVKTKIGDRFGSPEEMFDRRKMAKVERMASCYEPLIDIAKRIDVVAIVLNYAGEVERINHYEGVY